MPSLLAADTIKVKSREFSIINRWKALSGRGSIPTDSTYITLCGSMFDGSGQLIQSCELNHMVESGIINPQQFHGIDRDPTVCSSNRSALEATYRTGYRPTIHQGDFIDQLERLINQGVSRVSILNLDLQEGPENGIYHLTRALSLLNTLESTQTLVNWNIITNNPYHHNIDDRQRVFQILNSDQRFQWAITSGGWVPDNALEYKRPHTGMKSFMFWRPGA
jgi:hypothetical protein